MSKLTFESVCENFPKIADVFKRLQSNEPIYLSKFPNNYSPEFRWNRGSQSGFTAYRLQVAKELAKKYGAIDAAFASEECEIVKKLFLETMRTYQEAAVQEAVAEKIN